MADNSSFTQLRITISSVLHLNFINEYKEERIQRAAVEIELRESEEEGSIDEKGEIIDFKRARKK